MPALPQVIRPADASVVQCVQAEDSGVQAVGVAWNDGLGAER